VLDFGFYNMDCMAGMKEFPDNYFDLAIVDPPYGDAKELSDNSGGVPHWNRFGPWFDRYKGIEDRRWMGEEAGPVKKIIAWDVAPGEDYFRELFRVSRNQIIWGGNYFRLPPTRCFLVWRKLTISEGFTMAMAEYAWTSFDGNAKVYECAPQGKPGDRFHPTQKPVDLYRWIMGRYAKAGDKILDTHVGSASSLIAAHEAGCPFVGFEIDSEYYRKANARLEAAMAQTTIWDFLGGK